MAQRTTPFVSKNPLFSFHSYFIYKEIQAMNLPTVEEREMEYVRRVKLLPDYVFTQMKPPSEPFNELERDSDEYNCESECESTISSEYNYHDRELDQEK